MPSPRTMSPSTLSASKEGRPVLRSLPTVVINNIWVCFIVGVLVLMWCVIDSWNHDISSSLFHFNTGRTSVTDVKSVSFPGTIPHVYQPFNFTLTLAFLQFVFVGIVFCSIFAIKQASVGESVADGLAHIRPTISDGRWPALVTTHVCGSVLLQSLMMPTQMMSLGLFAATRAVEIPVAAGVRSKVLGPRFSGPPLVTTLSMFAAAWLLFFSYTEIAECLCVWSGFGVALSGAALYLVYAFLLTIPATNIVLQESMLVQLQVSPIAMLGIQNICASLLFVPILIAAQCSGYENVTSAFVVIASHREIYMMVIWLCVQTVAISAVTLGLIMTTDSFWAVSARSVRVVFWWGRQLQLYYFTSNMLLSVARPHASVWSLVMIVGLVLAGIAVVHDKREEGPEDKTLLVPNENKGFGASRYV